MKKKIVYYEGEKKKEKYISYIPGRYIFAFFLTILATLAILAIIIVLTYFVPFFYIAVILTQVSVALAIIASDENPDYKIPWLVVVLIVPIAGFMIYFMFSKRKLKNSYVKKIESVKMSFLDHDDAKEFEELKKVDPFAYQEALLIKKHADSALYKGTNYRYFPLGEKYMDALLKDLDKAEKFIFLEYFIIEAGVFWDAILEILKKKAAIGVEVCLVYDDIGCMMTLPGDYYKRLGEMGIKAVSFAKVKGNADSEFNNRSHRKIAVIDGKVGYTGGINLADEYINVKVKHGHWKDGGIRLEGEGVKELTKLFMIDYWSNSREKNASSCYFPDYSVKGEGFCMPFGDGPKPLYKERVCQNAILAMLSHAKDYVYLATPYLIIDNTLCSAIESAAYRGVDVRIITPHIPDKKAVFLMTRSYYRRLMEAGVRIYEYEPGFIHLKCYVSDDVKAIIGTVNLDYRSLVHHFENAVWIYGAKVVMDMKDDLLETMGKSIEIEGKKEKHNPFKSFFVALLRLFAPLF